MKIELAKIINYKSFKETEEISFTTGFNVIVGQNNVGKTALIEALSQMFTGNPHKSIEQKPNLKPPISSVISTISLEKGELNDILLQNMQEIFLPCGDFSNDEREVKRIFDEILKSETLKFEYQANASIGGLSTPTTIASSIRNICNVSQNYNQLSNYTYAHLKSSVDKTKFVHNGAVGTSKESSVDNQIYGLLKNNIYLFKAERLNIGICNSGIGQNLTADASNLPEVLHNLQTRNPKRFTRLINYIHKIFPSIQDISVRPVHPNRLEIITWTCDPATERDDLTIPLSDSGTGVGQALAILYVAITSDFPKVIFIDEPNSFLHPSATRKLIEILKEFSQHQFIVTTHSPEVIRAANPEKINLIKWVPPQSQIEQLEGVKLEEIGKCLIEVGAKLSDVFGADKILWVEGPTEEAAFSLFFQEGLLTTQNSINIVAVKNTGDFQRKKKQVDLILDIYQKLSNGNALIPSAIGFIFDKEKLTAIEIQDITRGSKGLISFLPRRMYENYLLHTDAIAAVMNTLPTFTKNKLTTENIDKWINEHAGEYVESTCTLRSPEWLNNVDAARLLIDLFSDISSSKESYDKMQHSIAITEWLISNRKEELKELLGFLSSIIR